MNNSAFKNTVLRNIPTDSIERLQLSPLRLQREHVIESPGDEIKKLYFIEEGLGSMTTMFKDGSQVEVGLFGNEAVIGASALIGTKRSLNNIYMQVPGHGYISNIQAATQEFRRRDQFHDIVLRYVQAQLVQTAQTAGCNAKHEAEQRMARWLLLCADRVYSDDLGLTHEFLGHMLGVRRATVSTTAEELQRRNYIDYRRGRIKILNRPALEQVACECYRIVKNHLENYHQIETVFGETLHGAA
ncbi:MAG TPA: Crp/Fnr family transcriptional regulator [Candidatus Sulfotelmatobacter sp.]|jgi:CRP-like cAMP-binding protein|nr:Crp/Fnr family transcriptional regulator [Candidatus Sulfotelmatobacter sp.]